MNSYGKRRWAVFAISFAISFFIMFFLYMLWTEGSGSLLGLVNSWLSTHDERIDLIAIWSLAVGFQVLAVVDFSTWITMVGQQDATIVGKRLRKKKLSYAVIFECVSILYFLTLYGYYYNHEFDLWTRLVVRIFLIVGIASAAVYGSRFFLSFRDQTRYWNNRDTEQDEREVSQDARDADYDRLSGNPTNP